VKKASTAVNLFVSWHLSGRSFVPRREAASFLVSGFLYSWHLPSKHSLWCWEQKESL